jgi:outer membrane receptor for ferrienterochelin and colicin
MQSGKFTNAKRLISDLSDWGNFGASIKYFKQWSDRLYSDITVASSHYFSKKNLGTQFDFNVQDSNAVFVSQNSKSLQGNNVYDFTLKFDNDYFFSSQHNVGFGIWFSNISTDYKYIVNDSLNILDKNENGYHFASYIQDKWKVNNSFEVTVGLRGTYFNPTKKIYLEPRTSFVYKFSPVIRLKGAWGNYYQFINQVTSENVLEGSRDFWLISNSELEPGSAQHYILGVEYETPGFLFSIEGYYKNLDNLLEFTQRLVRSSQSRLTSLTNYETNFFKGKGFAKGIEFLVQKKFGALSGWVSYTLGKVEYTFENFDSGDPFPANQDRAHEFKAVSSYEIGNWTFSASWIYSTGLPYTAPESQYFIELLDGSKQSYIHVSEKNVYRLPDYHRLDISASYMFKNKSLNGEVGVSVFNLYNQQNIWYKKYDLSVSPVEVTNITMLGITPTIFIKLNF